MSTNILKIEEFDRRLPKAFAEHASKRYHRTESGVRLGIDREPVGKANRRVVTQAIPPKMLRYNAA